MMIKPTDLTQVFFGDRTTIMSLVQYRDPVSGVIAAGIKIRDSVEPHELGPVEGEVKTKGPVVDLIFLDADSVDLVIKVLREVKKLKFEEAEDGTVQL